MTNSRWSSHRSERKGLFEQSCSSAFPSSIKVPQNPASVFPTCILRPCFPEEVKGSITPVRWPKLCIKSGSPSRFFVDRHFSLLPPPPPSSAMSGKDDISRRRKRIDDDEDAAGGSGAADTAAASGEDDSSSKRTKRRKQKESEHAHKTHSARCRRDRGVAIDRCSRSHTRRLCARRIRLFCSALRSAVSLAPLQRRFRRSYERCQWFRWQWF